MLAAVILIIYLLPVYVVVVMSLKPMTDHTSRLLPPVEIYLENYLKVFKNSNILNAMKNSLIITVGTVAIVVIAGCLAAYPIARNKGRLGRAVKIFVLGVMMVPGMSMVVGVYSTLVSIHAISTYWGIILVSAAFGLPFSIYMYSNFIAAIPDTLDEAAAIDGADVLTIFFKIILPLTMSGVVSGIIMVFVPALTSFAVSDLLGGGKVLLIGNVIEQAFMQEYNWNLGSGLSFVLMIFVIVSMAFMNSRGEEGSTGVW